MEHLQAFPPLTDIHCHILPELDDGADDWEEALSMARLAAAERIATIVATPHQLGVCARNHGPTIRTQTEHLQRLLDREQIAITVLPGAEVRVEPGLAAKLHSGELLTLADRRRHVLLELPHEVYVPLERLLVELRAAGITPILAHPERNLGLLARPAILPSLVRAGCLVQVTAASLTGGFGPEVRYFAQWLVRQGLAHFVATDAHNMQGRRLGMAKAFDEVRRLAGAEAALALCGRNPACVVSGSALAAPHSGVRAEGVARWLPWRKAS